MAGTIFAHSLFSSLSDITMFCFAASYSLALGLEVLLLYRRGRLVHVPLVIVSSAGLLAHTLYLIYHAAPLTQQPVSLLFLSWIIAVFYLYGSLHHKSKTWGLFVLPVVLALIGAAYLSMATELPAGGTAPDIFGIWVFLHVALIILGGVGICVAFVAGVMYLFQSTRLKHKQLSPDGLKLLSLERLEDMHRRAVNLAFPLLTLGLLIGLFLWQSVEFSWMDPKIISTALLWMVFVVLLFIRYGLHLRGRRIAYVTIIAFILLLIAFTIQFFVESSHQFGGTQ